MTTMTNRQTILIAGATGNIGGGAALALAKRGAHIVLLGRRREKLEARADAIRAALSEAQADGQMVPCSNLASASKSLTGP